MMDAQALGRFLRQTREAKELTLEDAERALRIRRRILESFELGDFNIPESSTVQIRGFVRNYASYLGLDEARILQFYEAARQNAARGPGRRKKKKRETGPLLPNAPRTITDTNPSLPIIPSYEPPKQRGAGLLTNLMRLLVALAALAVIVFVVVQLVRQPEEVIGVTPPPPDILVDLPSSPTVTISPTNTQNVSMPTMLPGVPTFSGEGVAVIIDIEERTWLRVVTDDVEQYAGIVTPGTHMEVGGQNTVTIRASNADALSIVWNGQQQGSFGARGQLVDVVFTRANVQISSGPSLDATSPFTPTPLPTDAIDVGAEIQALTPSNTPGPSPTPSDTFTPSDTPTITPTPSNTFTPSDTPTITPTPSNTPIPSDTPTITNTPSPTRTPTNTLTPTITPTPSATAILPPRVTPENLPPTKEGA